MKRFAPAAAVIAAVCLFATGALAQLAPIVSNAVTVGVNISTATTTELVPLAPNKATYVTFAHIEAGGTGNITFEYGSGTACATATTAIGGAISLTAQTGFASGSGDGPVIVVPAGKALCLVTSAAVQMSGWLTYAQF